MKEKEKKIPIPRFIPSMATARFLFPFFSCVGVWQTTGFVLHSATSDSSAPCIKILRNVGERCDLQTELCFVSTTSFTPKPLHGTVSSYDFSSFLFFGTFQKCLLEICSAIRRDRIRRCINLDIYRCKFRWKGKEDGA